MLDDSGQAVASSAAGGAKLAAADAAIVDGLVELARDWLNRPDNYLSIQAGGEGDLRGLVTALVRKARRDGFAFPG